MQQSLKQVSGLLSGTIKMKPSDWIALNLLRHRFTANVAALATRYPRVAEQLAAFSPAEPYSIRTEGDRVFLGVGQPPAPGANDAPARAGSCNCDEDVSQGCLQRIGTYRRRRFGVALEWSLQPAMRANQRAGIPLSSVFSIEKH